MSENKPPPVAKDDADWLNALDEWDSQIDDALRLDKADASAHDALPTEHALSTLRPDEEQHARLGTDHTSVVTEEEVGDDAIASDEPAPLDEPPPLDGFDLATVEQATLGQTGFDANPFGVADADAEPASFDVGFEPAGDSILLENPIDEEGEEPFAAAFDGDVETLGRTARRGDDALAEAAPSDALAHADPIPPAEYDRAIAELDAASDFGSQQETLVPGDPVAASAFDDDFYDDILIVPGRDEPTGPRPTPVAPSQEAPEVPLWDEPFVGGIRAEAGQNPTDDAPAAAEAQRLATPSGREEGQAAARGTATPSGREEGQLPVLVQRELVAKRPERPADVQPLEAESAAPLILLDEERGDLRSLVDLERLLAEPARVPELAFEGAFLSGRIGDEEGALERAEAVLAAEPTHRPALAIARRAAMSRRDLDQVASLLDRERAGATTAEQRALTEWASAVAEARGKHEDARALDAELPGVGSNVSAFAFAPARPERIAGVRERIERGDPRLVAALDVWAARDAEPDAAKAHLLAARGELRSVLVALETWRLAVQSRGVGEAAALDLLAEALPPSVLRSAVERRAAAVSDPTEGRERLAHLADAGDDVAAVLWSVDAAGAGAGDMELGRLARAVGVVQDPGQRAALRIALGAAEEARDHVGAALAAYEDAAREMPTDRRAERALERVRSRGGDKQAELARQLRIASLGDRRAAWVLYRAAALLVELDRPDEALLRVTEALERAPDDGEALALAVRIASLLGRPLVGAERLRAAAEASTDAALTAALRRRSAAALFAAGSPAPAIEAALDSGGSVEERLDVVRRLGLGATSRLRDALDELAESARPTTVARARIERATLDETIASEELRNAVALRPDHAGAIAWATRLLRAESPEPSTDLLVARAAAQSSPLEQRDALLDAVLALAADRQDLAAAIELAARGHDPVVAAERTSLERRRGRGAHLTAAYDAALGDETSPERRAVLLVDLSRAHRRGGENDRALDRLRLAHDALPAAPAYRDILESALERVGDTARLTDLALADLKEAQDSRRKAQAYERLAFIDECLRGDLASARMSYESIAEIDQNAQDAARRLERHLILEKRGADLVHLYDRMGIAAQDPRLAVALTLERARLRRRIPGALDAAELDAAVENDLRLVLFQDPRNRVALRETYLRATEKRDSARRLELGARLADVAMASQPVDARSAAVFGVRAAESALKLGRQDEALQRLREAATRPVAHLPALLGMLDLALRTNQFALATDAAEQIQRVQREPGARREAGLLAAALAQKELADLPRAARLLRAVLDADPHADVAFVRLRALLELENDHAGLAELLGNRLRVEPDGQRVLDLRVEVAGLLWRHGGDLGRARAELTSALTQDPNHPEALPLLAEIEEHEGNHYAAAELLLRRARVEKSRDVLANLLFKLAQLYAAHVGDDKRAVQCLVRVLQLEPERKEALELAAEVYAREEDWLGVLTVLQQLATVETDLGKRVELLHRAAKVQEEGFKDTRHALTLYRAALELNPTYLPAVDELARFFDRQSDTQSLRVLVDTTARRLRAGLSGGPRDAGAFHSLFRIFALRRAPDRMAMTAGVLEWMGSVEPDERSALDRLRLREQYPGSALADAALDDFLFDARVPAGVRNVLRLVEEPLAKSLRVDVKALGLSRADRLPKSGHAVRDIGNRIAADLGLRDFDVYVSAHLNKAAVLELSDPLAMCIGAALLEGAHELELRFLFARFFKMAQLRLAVALRLEPGALAALVAGVVRQFVPDFQPAGVDAALIASESARLQKVLPKKMIAELHPFALECSSPSFDLLGITSGLNAAADRAGLLACGTPTPALGMLERMGADGAARALALFAVGDELPELRHIVATSIG